MRAYLAGPMSNLPQMNFPAFDAAAKNLRAFGFDVVSPAELDSPEARAAALASPDGDVNAYAEKHETWGTLLARDVKLIADEGIEAIVVLPGWADSRGACLETFVGRLCGLPILEYPDLNRVPPPMLRQAHSKACSVPAAVIADPSRCTSPLSCVEEGVGWDGKPVVLSSVPSPETGDSEVRVINEKTGGAKGTKPERYGLLPWAELDEVARLYAFGATKYTPDNWRRGYDWHLSFDALIRHARAFWEGEETDEETDCSHMASVVFHALALMYFAKHHPDLDDRSPYAVRN